MRPWLLPIGLSLLVMANTAQSQTTFDWHSFDALLKQHVTPSRKQNIPVNLVDYNALKASSQFNDIAKQLAQFDPSHLNRQQQLVFYINAYNYFALKLVADHYPLDSIKDLGNILFPVWKKHAGEINGESISLDYIEHTVLRSLDEPAIHFAIVCASLSCPDLRTEAYTEQDLKQQLTEQIQGFLKQSKGVQIEGEGQDKTLYLSKIFKWFESDFKDQGGVITYLSKYEPALESFEDFETLDYNWQVNSQ